METSESANLNGQRPEGNSGRGANALTVGQRVDRVRDTAQETWSRTRDAVNELKDRFDLDGRVRRNPYGTVAAALGVGYVLGGGFFSPLTARIFRLGLRIGLRLAAIPFLENEIRSFAETVVSGAEGDDDEAAAASGEGKRSQQKSTKGGKR
jgi:ElaB/YqjD/DUF883 family membrane-anchored ribosome-binding protein